MEPIEIIRLAPEDWPAYRELRLQALHESPQAFSSRYADALLQPDSYWQERLRAALAEETSWLLFARAEGRLVGMVGAFRVETSRSVDIISVYVVPEKRGQGVAGALLAAILAEVSKQPKLRTAKLTVNATQAHAVNLYRRFGFEQVGETPAVMGDGNTYLEYLMEKRLRPADDWMTERIAR